jgi:hypothetical protein
MEKLLALLSAAIVLVVITAAISALIAWPVQLLWNSCLVGAVSGVHAIDFLQAWNISLLCGLLLLKSSGSTSN